MAQKKSHSITSLLTELLNRIEQDQDGFIDCLSQYSVEELSKLKQALESYSMQESLTYRVNDYAGSQLNRYILDFVDKHNSCKDLILGGPTILISPKKEIVLQDISIHEAKKLISEVIIDKFSSKKENALIARLPYYGPKDGKKFRDAINFYEEQVLRQAKEATCLEENLFVLNRDKKSGIILDNYSKIVDYFIDTADMCVWGNLGKSHKLKLQYSKRAMTEETLRIRNNFVRMLADYTTLSELEKGPIKSKVLDRFIIKDNN